MAKKAKPQIQTKATVTDCLNESARMQMPRRIIQAADVEARTAEIIRHRMMATGQPVSFGPADMQGMEIRRRARARSGWYPGVSNYSKGDLFE